MVQVKHWVDAMERIAPLKYAEPWDNVGLLVGDSHAEVSRVWLTIDATVAELQRAHEASCDAVCAYHPLIFKGVRRLGPREPAFVAARLGLSVYSPHTALDVAQGGTNDCLAQCLGLSDLQPLRAWSGAQAEAKLVMFVPASHAEKVSQAVFHAGAGRIGAYSQCSFKHAGEGTFYGEEGTSPYVGEQGQLQCVPEVRVETRVSLQRLPSVLRAMHETHPYEHPAYDVLSLASEPSGVGLGRIGVLPESNRDAWVQGVCAALGVKRIASAWPENMGAFLKGRVAVCAGSGSDMVDDVLASNVRMFVTGELRHHDVLRLLAHGVAVCCTEHAVSEYPVLAAVAAKLHTFLPSVQTVCSPSVPFLFVQ